MYSEHCCYFRQYLPAGIFSVLANKPVQYLFNMGLIHMYKDIRGDSTRMCEPLEIEDYIPQPVAFVSPPKWNLGHTTWFFEEFVLKPNIPFYKVFHPKFGYLFNSYYQAVGERVARNRRGDFSRPVVKEIFRYRAYVDEHMEELMGKKDLVEEVKELIILGLNHEQQHQELFLTDLKYTFSFNPLHPEYSDNALVEEGEKKEHDFVAITGGVTSVGAAGAGFFYDNELSRHRVYIQPFQMRKSLVTNKEYAEFVESGGYEAHEYWHDDAWTWIKRNDIKHPMYWRKQDGKWEQYTLAGIRLIKENHPVTHINYYEAAAFASWKGMRLPTEFEWEAASAHVEWGDRWEWTESAYLPYPGYKRKTGAVGEYNGKFMVNQKVLRGASVATPKGHIERNTYRNFFHPHIGYQFNGIRLAK